MTAKSTINTRILIFGLIILAWLVSGYLSFRSSQLSNPTELGTDYCQFFFGKSCDQALTNRAAWQLGYPLANWSLIYFGLVGLLFAFDRPILDKLALFLVSMGVGVGMMLLTYTFVRDLPFCSFCLIVHVLNIMLWLVLWFGVKPFPGIGVSQKRSFLFKRLGLMVIMLIFGGVLELMIIRAGATRMTPMNFEELIVDYLNSQTYEIPFDSISPRTGPLDAPVKLVVFSSFQCPACKMFSGTTHMLANDFGDSLSIVFKHFPLSSSCNPVVIDDMQPQSCAGAAAAIAAQRQQKFWEYHDGLFRTDLNFDDATLIEIAQKNELDLAQWEKDRTSNLVSTQIVQDSELAYRLGVNGTPTVFINGKRMDNFQQNALKVIIRKELDRYSEGLN